MTTTLAPATIAKALSLTAADYSAVWVRFRSAVARNAVLRTTNLQVPEMPVISITGVMVQVSESTSPKIPLVQDVGFEHMRKQTLPYKQFVMIDLALQPNNECKQVTLGGLPHDISLGDLFVMTTFVEWDGVWGFSTNVRLMADGTLGVGHHDSQRHEVEVREHSENLFSQMVLFIGLLLQPAEVAIRASATRPLSKGRRKPHPLAPASLLTLSFDPQRLITPNTEQRGSHASLSFAFYRRGIIVTNKKGMTFERRPTMVMKHLPPRDVVRVARLTET